MIRCEIALIKRHAEVALNLAGGELHHFFREGGLHPDPEGVVHYVVSVGQVATDPVLGALHVGLAGQVAGKQQTCSDLVLIQVGQQVEAGHWAVVLERDRKTKPRRV